MALWALILESIVPIKEKADQNALHGAYAFGSFHVILDKFVSTLIAMKCFTNKQKNLCIRLHWRPCVIALG